MAETFTETSLEAERLKLALLASNEGIWDWMVGEKKIYYSERILEFLDCGVEEATNFLLPPYQAVHPQEREYFTRELEGVMEKGKGDTLAVDARVRKADETWIWMRIRGSVVRDGEGNALRIAGSMIDISLRKGAEAQIEEERYLLRDLIDHVPLPIYFKDLESRIILANRGMIEWHGKKTMAELAGKRDRDLFASVHSAKAEADEKRIMETGTAMTGQLECETWREGEETFVLTSKFPWREKDGTIKGTFGISNDVTTLVKAQRQATQLAEEVQQKNTAYEEELMLAREIQHALTTDTFPEVTCSGGNEVSFGSRYLPISGLAGDFYEVIPLPGGKYGLFICDVMGHGIRSALIVSMLRGLLAVPEMKNSGAADFMKKLNDGISSILAKANVTMFATAFYGILDPEGLTLEYACAGHPGPVVVGLDSNHQICAERKEKGPALGLFKERAYPSQTMKLDDVRRLLLYTDGVVEAENEEGEQFLNQRLLSLVNYEEGQGLEAWLEHIIETVLDFSEGHHFDDDVCLLGVDIRSVGS